MHFDNLQPGLNAPLPRLDDDDEDEEQEEAAVLKECGAKIEIVQLVPGRSTTKLVEKMSQS